MSGSPVTVVAAMIWQHGKILICQRREMDPFPGKWEFPGGKVESGEEPRAALRRELFEELGIRARIGAEVAQVEHQYPGSSLVHLLFFTVQDFDGVPKNLAFKQILWVSPQELSRFDFLEADRPLIERIAGCEFSPPGC